MKKLSAVFLCFCLAFTLTGCNPGELIDKYILKKDAVSQNTASGKSRVYMDELTGELIDFNGSQLTVKTETENYIFDVSQATLECEDGMITGDEISVIYEGQLTDTDTSTVKALKVVDEFHKKNRLKDRTTRGKVVSLTPNTITLKAKSGKTATYPITGAEQYYQNGIKAGNWVHLHFKGHFPQNEDKTSTVLNASHLKVLSISDIDPLTVPKPTPTPSPENQGDEKDKPHRLRASIQTVSANTLTVKLQNSETTLTLDMSRIPCYFKGGTAPGSTVKVYYTGQFDGSTLEGISVSAITGENPASLNNHKLDFTVTGTIIGKTANTVTIQTNDGAVVTCRIDDAQNYSTGEFMTGAGIRITFNPSVSRESNIYTAVKIEDA